MATYCITAANHSNLNNHVASSFYLWQPVSRTRIASANASQMAMIDAYVSAKGVYNDICMNNQFATSTIRTYLKGIGLIDLSGSDRESKIAAAKAFFCEKRSLAESAQAGGVKTDVLEKMVRKMGERVASVWQRIGED